jgi:integrase
MPKISSTREYLEPEEIERIISKCPAPFNLLIEALYSTGGRISELLSVTPADIDFKNGEIWMPALKRRDVQRKHVSVSINTASKLQEYCKGKPVNQRLFPWTRQQCYYRLRLAADKAHVKGAYLHLLRHSLATHWALKGGDLTILQRQLGHKRLSTTTDRYVRYAVKDLQNERNRIGMS